ncbi:DNA repair and recombination protein RAD54B isoform X3 [Octopus sinensis]|uniref:DNA repair and recombination protein RAD54B isoform X3 n=1 Tax=Octopus sinensis TaxID=2607531 RepID=A0A7E6FB58_9MOLL|nr:DNA repair and recombination protein RAD54B isoform X3 [Octopus sinensis]
MAASVVERRTGFSMRRSIAPSQTGAAKRTRFLTPFKGENEDRKNVPLFNRGLNVLTNPDTDQNGDYKNDENSSQNSSSPASIPRTFACAKSNPSIASSQSTGKTHSAVYHSPLALSSENKQDNESNVQNGSNSAASPSVENYYSVVWSKLSKKKHKKWEGDAVLVTHGRKVTLYDMEGKEIGKMSGYKESMLSSLEEDHTLTVGGKEILVMSRLPEESFKSGKCFLPGGGAPSSAPSKSKDIISRPFVSPQLTNNAANNNSSKFQKTTADQVDTLAPRHDPLAFNALVMPRPSQDHQWHHNKNSSVIVDVVVDPYISRHLRPHQREGIVFLYECVMGMRDFNGNGAILADDMGLGKTLQCIGLLWTLYKQGPYGGKPVLQRILIVTPSSLVKNWYQEFKKWLGTERISVFTVEADKKIEEYLSCPKCPVLIISYEMFLRNVKELEKVSFDLVICDEGHRLKNTSIKTSALLNSLPVRRRLVLSGTPVQNDLQEFFAIVEFCNPGILGTSSSFHKIYELPIITSRQPTASKDDVNLGMERAAELTRLTKLFLLRRCQDINNKYLPPKVELVVFCRPSSLQLTLYRQILSSQMIRRFLAGHYDGASHLISIAALKKLCNHPALLYQSLVSNDSDEDEEGSVYQGLAAFYPQGYSVKDKLLEHGSKLNVLAAILSGIFATTPREKVVLIANHTKTLDLLSDFCESQGYNCCRLDGQTPSNNRLNIVKQFNTQNSNHFIFLLSLKAGGVGLNLVGASRLILYDIDWNPANDIQAMARVWRDGQKRKVHLYRLLTTGTIEEKIYQRQINKQSLSGAVIECREKGKVKFSLEELRDLFTLNEQTQCDTHDLLKCPCRTGGHIEEIPNKLTPVRPCQLGAVPETDVLGKKNLTMDELMDWKHLSPEEVSSHLEWHLPSGPAEENYVTFAFWSETKNVFITEDKSVL